MNSTTQAQIDRLYAHYPIIVTFRFWHKAGARRDTLGHEDTIHHVSVERAQAWIDGIKKNCKTQEFYGEPVIKPNPHYVKK